MRATIISSARTIGVKIVSSSEGEEAEEVAVAVDLLTSVEIVVVVVPAVTEEAGFFVFIRLIGLTKEAKTSRTDSLEVE